MPSATLRNVGSVGDFSPIMKRATGTLSDGSVVMMVPDAAIASINGTDTTGVAKIAFYKSDTTRTTWTLNLAYTPSPAASSASISFVGSMVLDTSDNIHLVYAGTDGSLNYVPFTYSGGTYTAGTKQTVSASSAVTRRWRALDIDIAGTTNPAIMAYESKTSAGLSAFHRCFIRLNDGTTWRTAYTEDQAILGGGSIPIYEPSEDVSLSYNLTGVVSNVVQILFYATRVGQFTDRADICREISFNVSTGTDGSATTLGTWPVFNQNVAATRRRGWVFKTTNNLWQVAMSLGTTRPSFQVMRLQHGAYSAPIVNSTSPTLAPVPNTNGVFRDASIQNLTPSIDWNGWKYNPVACAYADNRVFFGFITSNTLNVSGAASGFTMSGVVFRYNNASDLQTTYADTLMRPLDNYFTAGDRPMAIYGSGNNRNQAGDLKFNFLAFYGYTGNVTTSGKFQTARAVIDTFYDPPVNVGPTSAVSNDTPTLQVRVSNSALYPNIKGKIEWNLATDSAFTTNLKSILEPDANYRYFGSTTNSVPPNFNISLMLSGVGTQKLFSGTWYVRSRVVSDLGQVSSWSATTNFIVSHKPAALPLTPAVASLTSFTPSGIVFTWSFSDTEPTDTQTAYQLKVVRTDTGATVFDSTKTSSTLQTATVALSSTLKDVPLQWTVSLWDTDDVQGAFSNPVAFMIGDGPAVRVTSPTDGSTVTTASPTVSWAFIGSGTRTQKAYRVSLLDADDLDTFTRTVSNGWGTSDSGDVWSVVGTASLYSVGSGVGNHQHTATNVAHISVTANSVHNADQVVEVSTPSLSTGASQRIGLIARYVDSNNYFWCEAVFDTAANILVGIHKRVSGVESLLGTEINTGLTHVAGTRYKLRFRIVENQLQVKLWTVGQAEPALFQQTQLDSALNTFGQLGTFSRLDSGNTNITITVNFDNYVRNNSDVPSVVATSNWVQGNAGSYTFPTNSIVNSSNYLALVEVQDSGGMTGFNSTAFVSTWTTPADGDETLVVDDFGITINWTNANQDLTFLSWRVYRKYMVPALADLDDGDTANTWVLIYETSAVQTSYSYKDYLVPLNKSVQYAVVQVADRFGSPIESALASPSTATCTGDRYFFVPAVPIGTIASYEAGNITDDSFTVEVESETIHVLNRGRQVQVGDNLGATGTLTIQLRGTGARADREFLEYLASSKSLNVWMKNPFGDVRLVKLLSVQVKYLAGVGTTEMSDLTVPYVEVFQDAVVTR